MSLALFDLDNTLLAADSDYLWGVFLVEQGLVDADEYERANQRFYDDYKAGRLDIFEFLRFSLRPLSQHDMATLQGLHRAFMQQHILPVMTEKGKQAIARHKAQGDCVVIITATNRFITGPIAEAFGADALIATEPQIIAGRYTGEVEGAPCFQHGKIERLQQWMQPRGISLDGSWFYSDSHNDLPLLEQVSHPVAVDPDDTLRHHAEAHGWPVISFR